jgi:hypothetical protein
MVRLLEFYLYCRVIVPFVRIRTLVTRWKTPHLFELILQARLVSGTRNQHRSFGILRDVGQQKLFLLTQRLG